MRSKRHLFRRQALDYLADGRLLALCEAARGSDSATASNQTAPVPIDAYLPGTASGGSSPGS